MPERPFLTISGNRKREAQTGEYPSGLERHFAQAGTTLTTSALTFQNALTLTTGELAGGNYKIDFSFLYATSNQTKQLEARIVVDGTQVWLLRDTTSNSTFRKSGSGFIIANLSAAVHTIEIQYMAPAGTAVSIYGRRLSLERWN